MDVRVSALSLLCVAVLGALCAEYPAPPYGLRGPELDRALREGESARAPRATANQKWLHRVEEYARAQMDKLPRGPPRPFRIDLPLAGSDESLPVLVLPVPIFEGSCGGGPAATGLEESAEKRRVVSKFQVQAAAAPASGFNPDDDENDFVGPPTTTSARPPPRLEAAPLAHLPKTDDRNDYVPPLFTQRPVTTPKTTQNRFGSLTQNNNDDSDFVPPSNFHQSSFSSFSPSPSNGVLPPFGSVGSVRSEDLVTKFRLQQPSAPSLPPALLPHSPHGAEVDAFSRAPLTAAPAPPQPRWARSLLVRGEVTVPRADYTEPYTVWWDAASGSSRVEMHGGASASYSELLPGTKDRYRLSTMSVDRSSGGSVRRCSVSEPHAPAARDTAPPTLPDPAPYSFAGFSSVSGRQVEVWQYRTQEATHSEELTYRHELVVERSPRGDAVPLRYTVGVDSSVLGADCDGWEHRYTEVLDREHNAADLKHDLEGACDATETLRVSNAEERARLQPLREFTLPIRDPRYVPALKRFMSDYQRVYVDDKEEAVRKNLFIQHSRFVSSCNREGGSFEVAVNFLGDRLDVELDVLLGVVEGAEGLPAERFPHPESDLARRAAALPDQFDWRKEGAVSHVRYQGSCSSCWAMAVTGAVEGALWVRTRRLVPLAEQCLVDCAHPYGGHGCGGTWPSHAYDYIKDNGLPALDEYGQHKEKVEKCRDKEVSPVTHISAHVNVTRNNLPALKVAIKEHAPSVVVIDAKAKSFIFYKKGVLFDNRCGKKSPRLNHAVLAVGWGTEGEEGAAAGAGGGEYITVKNSWSAAWGEEGYARLQAAANTCGVLALPSYPRLEDGDVDRRL